jgi:hypothetical protein
VYYVLQIKHAQQLVSQTGESEKMADTHGVKRLSVRKFETHKHDPWKCGETVQNVGILPPKHGTSTQAVSRNIYKNIVK